MNSRQKEIFKLWYILLKINDLKKIEIYNKIPDEEEIFKHFEKLIPIETRIKYQILNYNKVEELKVAEYLLDELERKNIKYITYNSKEYPSEKFKILAENEEEPFALFYKGNIDLLKEKMISIVGARICTSYGCEVSKFITKEIVKCDYGIISGGARGIDSIAHREAMRRNGKTIAVLGCGIDIVYPKENIGLFNEIERKGLLISEFLPGTAPLKRNFPIRNRIISALSEGVIAIEAAEDSGTMRTIEHADNQNRKIMVMPGSIFSKVSVGCNQLAGHHGITTYSTITSLHDFLGVSRLDIKESLVFSGIKGQIFNVISEGPTHIDQIYSKTKVDRDTLLSILFEMQINNEIINLPGNYYAKIS